MTLKESLATIVSDGVMEKAEQLIEDDAIISAKMSEDKIIGEVKSSSGDNVHSCSINDIGEFSCGCRGQIFNRNRLCSHLTAIILDTGNEDFVRRVAKHMFKGDVEPIFIPTDIFNTSLEGLNELLKGGIPLRSLFGLYGKYKAGKTILTQQMAWEVMKEYGMNALLFDTESDYFKPDAIPIWASRYNERFGLDAQLVRISCQPKWTDGDDKVIDDIELKFYPEKFDKDRQTAFIVDEGKFEILIALHGKPVAPHLKGGKIDLMPMDTELYVFYVNQSKLGNFIENNNIKFISYDSITRPLGSFHGGRLNYPVRNEAENLWFGQIDELLKTYNMISICTHRQTDNPTNPYSRAGPKGGQAIGHWFKRMIHLHKLGKSVRRRLKVWRSPTEAEWGESSWKSDRRIYLSNEGFKDIGE